MKLSMNWFYFGMFILFGNSLCLGYFMTNANIFNIVVGILGVIYSVLILIADKKRN